MAGEAARSSESQTLGSLRSDPPEFDVKPAASVDMGITVALGCLSNPFAMKRQGVAGPFSRDRQVSKGVADAMRQARRFGSLPLNNLLAS